MVSWLWLRSKLHGAAPWELVSLRHDGVDTCLKERERESE